MIRQLTCFCFLVAASITQVQAEEGCPYPSAVKFVDGHFQATNGRALWQSPKVDYHDFADRFVGAIFTPGKDRERENGYLERCVYRMGSGQIVSLRYDVPGKLNTMSLTSSLHWVPASDALKQSVYICEDNQPDNCSFTVGERN